jgi:hypothetical protein
MQRKQTRKRQQQSQEWWHLSWLPGHLGNRKGITHVTWWSPSYLLLIDALKVSLWAFWIRFNGWRIWYPVCRTNCTNNKNVSVQLLKKHVLGTIYGKLFFKHYHLHSKTRKKIQWNLSSRTTLITNNSVHKFSEKKCLGCRTVSRVMNTQASNNGWRQAESISGTASVAV